jgi:hypothetical protein
MGGKMVTGWVMKWLLLQKCLHRCNGLATKLVEIQIQWLLLTKIGFLMNELAYNWLPKDNKGCLFGHHCYQRVGDVWKK